MKSRTIAALICALSFGCVSAGEHEELLMSHAKLQKELAQTKSALQKESEERRATQAQLDAMIAERDRMSKEMEARQTELANVMKDKASLSSSVEDMKKAMDDLARRKAEADKRIAEFRSLLDRFKALIDAGKLRVKIVEGRMVVELATDVLFSSGSASLSKDGKTAIEEVATVLKDIPDRRFQVEGHTDDVPIRTAQYPSNWELASSRAVNVVKAMVDAGMPAERISAASYGQNKPAKPNDSPEGKAANRRIEIVLVPDLSSLPGFEELQKVAR
jgi:chemotaxis protein MotB